MTTVIPARRPKPPRYPLSRVAAVCWLALVILAGSSVSAQTSNEPAIGFAWAVSPDDPGPGSGFTIEGTITIDPASGSPPGEGGTIAWTLTVGPISDVAIDNATCGTTDGTSCETDINDDDDTVTFSGAVESAPPGEVTADVEITGTINDQLDRDTILFEAETCGTVEVVTGTPAPGRLPIGVATPDAACEGVEGTIEVTVAPATEVPTEDPTEIPIATPTEAPTATPTEAPTTTPTEEPTTEPTAPPTATPEPTAEPTATFEPTAPPSEAPAPTSEPTSATVPTAAPTATIEPTAIVPTDVPTEAPTATPPPTEAPVVDPTALATEPPRPTPDANDDGNDAGLWIGGGTLLVLAAAAGAVLYQRRKLSA